MSAANEKLPLHPWNANFEWQDHTGPRRTLGADQLTRFDEDGFFVVENAFTRAELAPVIAELDGYEAQADAFLATREDERLAIAERGAIVFAPHLVERSPLLADFACHPTLLSICADLIGPDVDLYWDQAVYKKPEKPRAFPWHQDNAYAFVRPQQYLTCWVALNAATLDNGCPHVAPGLHRQGTLAHRYVEPLGFEAFDAPPRSVAAPVGAGGIVVFSSLTPHLTGPNCSDAVRKAYILQYTPAGAVVLRGDPRSEPIPEPVGGTPSQFPVLRGGCAVPRLVVPATRHGLR
jgi:ectoine hydroxylase-related dioxygenase (phytanoyl-CoA dioxygenase family)